MKYFDVRFTCVSDEEVMSLMKLFALIKRAGDLGTCHTIEAVVDGDGSGKIGISLIDETGSLTPIPTKDFVDHYFEDGKERTKIWIGE